MEDYILTGMDDFEGASYNTLSLFHNNTLVGTFSFYINYDLYDQIISVTPHLAQVQPNFCRNGLGTNLIRRVCEDYIVYFRNANNAPVEDKEDIHYSDEGLAWMRKCLRIAGVRCDEETFDEDYEY